MSIKISKSTGLLTVKIFCIIFSVFLFFFLNNKFLISHSLKNLEASLAMIDDGSGLGVEDVLNKIALKAVLEDRPKDSLKASHAQALLSSDKSLEGTRVLLSSMISEEKKKRGPVLNLLNKVAKKANELGDSVLSLGRRKTQDDLKIILKEALELFKQKSFKQAAPLFKEVIRFGRGTSSAKLAKVYLRDIGLYESKHKEIETLLEEASRLHDYKELQKAYYKVATLYLEITEYQTAEDYFKKALSYIKTTPLAQKIYFNLGVTKKMQGDLDGAKESFTQLKEEFPQSKLSFQIKAQLVDVLYKEGKTSQAAKEYVLLAKEFKDEPGSDVLLFMASNIYNFDLADVSKAEDLLEDLLKEYPASDLIASAEKLFKKAGISLGKKNLSLKDKILIDIFRTSPLTKKLYILGEKTSAAFALYMIEGSIQQALAQKKQKGDTITIERTDKQLTEVTRHRLDKYLSGSKKFAVSLESFSIKFPEDGYIETKAVINIGGRKVEGFVNGRMYIKKVRDSYNIWKEEDTPKEWVVYDIEEAKIGTYNLPVVVINEMLNAAQATFNKKQVFKQEKVEISPLNGVWQGEVKYDEHELKQKLEEIEDLKKKL